MNRQITQLDWLVHLRWWGALGQLFTLAFARWSLGSSAPLSLLLVIIAVSVASNIFLMASIKRLPALTRNTVGSILLFDIVLLTLLLFWTGGQTNPFSVFFLVYVTLGAVILGAEWTWALALVCCFCFGSMFLFEHPMIGHDHHHEGGHFSAHLYGMWIAFVLACAIISRFLTRIMKELSEKNEALKRMEILELHQEQLSSLATLSAGAAHELKTPLSTISVVANELSRAVEKDAGTDSLRTDAKLIASEVERCRSIIDQMGAKGGDLAGELVQGVNTESFLNETIGEVQKASRDVLVVECEAGLSSIEVPSVGLKQALVALINNALDATDDTGRVLLRIFSDKSAYVIQIADNGSGMSPEILTKASEPFFTTKEPGEGMGLGLFLASLFAERVSGSLDVESEIGAGTTVTLRIPFSAQRDAA